MTQSSESKWMTAAILVLVVASSVFAGGSGEAEARNAPAEPAAAAAAGDIADPAPGEAGEYLAFTPGAFDAAADRQRVLFFHAGWCPTCRNADRAFRDNLDRIPSDVVLLRTDYDSQRELRQRYAVTYQHTYVLVDADGELVRRWAGGDIDALIANTRG